LISYSKYSGAGNTFLFFDNRQRIFPKERISSLCDLEEVDGIILLEESCRMRIFNKDGSEASMCGNGLRCFIRYLEELGIRQPLYKVQTGAGVLEASIIGEDVEVKMSDPHSISWDLPLMGSLQFLNTGVPHAISFLEEIETIDLMDLGPKIRFHPHFGANGTNANFATLKNGELHLRTFERGVEGETLACGTGAVAAAIASAKKFSLPSPITVWPRSKEKLTISFQRDQDRFFEVRMRGPAKKLSQGSLNF
jgi:diaminopimelate epimerase